MKATQGYKILQVRTTNYSLLKTLFKVEIKVKNIFIT